jgi:hypothetical protein
MQDDTSGAVEVVEPETELVLVTGRRIDAGELFWPEEDALYVLASTWQAVDPLDDDSDSISCMIVPRGKGHLEHQAMQELVQLTFTPQPGGMLWRAAGSLGALDVFEGALPTVASFLSQQEALGARFSLVAIYWLADIPGWEPKTVRTWLAGCVMAADIRFSPIP